MDQLLKVTSVPFQTICFTQSARLLPADSVTLERQKALARHSAMSQRYRSGNSAMDFDYINQVNKAFSKKTVHDSGTSAVHSSPAAVSDSASRPPARSVSDHLSAPGNVICEQPESQKAAPIQETAKTADEVSLENSSSYTMQRGAFELRVAKGELSYIPPLVMTIVTQYPDVEFEYIGGFNYFPPPEESSEMNLTI